MKFYLSVLFFFIFLFVVEPILGQSINQMERYFPSFVLPEHWFDRLLTSDEYIDYAEKSRQINNLFWSSSSLLPFNSLDRYASNTVLNIKISRGYIRSVVENSKYNSYRTGYQNIQLPGYNWHALDIYYRPKEVFDLTNVENKTFSSSFEKQQMFIKHPSGHDKLFAWFDEQKYHRDDFIRGLIHEDPSRVSKHWDEIPDAPKTFGMGQKIDPKAYRRGVEVVMRRQVDLRIPKTMEKVEIIENPLKISGSENIQFSQSYLENWVKGGQSSYALLSDLRLNINYKDTKVEWENAIIHKVGFIAAEESKSRINDDLIDFSSKYGVIASKKWFYSLLFNFKTQMFKGYAGHDHDKETPISAFMAPAYFSMAAGMDYKTNNFTLLLSPVTSRMTVVGDTALIDQTRYSIPDGKRSMFFVGGSLQNNLTWDITQQIKLTSALNIFYDYFAKGENVQSEWDMILDMKINVFLSTRIVSNLRYFESESNKIQLREGLSISFRYNF